MSIKALSDYTTYAKYARYNSDKKRRETWREQVDRVFDMHEKKYASELAASEELRKLFDETKDAVYKKKVLGSQRALQFGGDPILKRNDKIYNCATTYIDRPTAFQHVMYMLLCGCGVGFSVQKHHVEKLPNIKSRSKGPQKYVIEDSIEGWADAVGVLVNSYFVGKNTEFNEYQGHTIKFDGSQIRPKGAFISGGFKAPGPEPLLHALKKIEEVIEARLAKGESTLHPIDVYDIIMHASDGVLSGGVRRSACIALFSLDDKEMMTAKTGDWYYKNPQRGRSNNSVALVRDEVDQYEFEEIIKSVKEFGEPGFVFLDDKDTLVNPCVEIGMWPQTEDGESGVQYCNLTEINGKKCVDEESFLEACKYSAVLGTIQAGYTDFAYLGETTEKIVRREALLGCSITGMMDNPDVLFDIKLQNKGANLIKKVNGQVAKLLNINPAARVTAIKPAGSTSCVLGTSSGIHPHHAKRYLRRVQANKLEFPAQKFSEVNPLAVEESVLSANNSDVVVTFLCEVPPGAITKNTVSAIDLLERVKLTQQNWVETGTREELCVKPFVRHNVSNTITVQPDEWDVVAEYLYKNRKWFTGVSLLPTSGDKDYPQAPFTTVYTPTEIVKMYGDGAVMASGVIVDGLKAYDGNLWRACDVALGITNSIHDPGPEIEYPKRVNNKTLAEYYVAKEEWESMFKKWDWLRRAKQFAERYFNGDIRQMTYCLKDVHNWKRWCDLQREYKEIDWSEVVEEDPFYESIDTMGAQACAGGACELK